MLKVKLKSGLVQVGCDYTKPNSFVFDPYIYS